MTSLLRQLVAGPRNRHSETGLDFCYVTDDIIASSGPSSTYPKRAYRNPLETFVGFLDKNHGSQWFIWEFRAEGTGYNDSEVYNRISHFPWPDHHPPPFALIPRIMVSMHDWLKGPDAERGRIIIVHCKAGKGRSGTVVCSYLISEEGWASEDALARFTSRRMRAGFGEGISIPSQQRWVRYVEWWTKHGKVYVDRTVEILEIRILGLRDGVEVTVESYVNDGRMIETFHTFSDEERITLGDASNSELDASSRRKLIHDVGSSPRSSSIPRNSSSNRGDTAPSTLFRPSKPIVLPMSDVNIAFERRNKAMYGFNMTTSVAHVWFNAFFESQISSADTDLLNIDAMPASMDLLPDSGVFSIPWESMDGVRGFTIKGARALDKVSVVWRYVPYPTLVGK